MDEPIRQQTTEKPSNPVFGNSFSQTLPEKKNPRMRSEKKSRRRKLLSPAKQRKASPNSVIDRSQLPTKMNEFYHELSSSDNSSISDHLSKLKCLFKGSNLQKTISRPASRLDESHEKFSKSLPKKHTRGRNISIVTGTQGQSIVRSLSHTQAQSRQIKEENKRSPYVDMLDLMRSTTNEFN